MVRKGLGVIGTRRVTRNRQVEKRREDLKANPFNDRWCPSEISGTDFNENFPVPQCLHGKKKSFNWL